MRIPEYTYGQLRKGIICSSCTSFLASFTQGYLACGECGSKEKVDTAVLRSAKEYAVLFPDRKMTTNTIVDWCGGVCSRKVVQRILVKNYEKKEGESFILPSMPMGRKSEWRSDGLTPKLEVARENGN